MPIQARPEKSLFLAALEIRSAAECAAVLDRAGMAIELLPNEPDFWEQRAQAHVALGQYENADAGCPRN